MESHWQPSVSSTLLQPSLPHHTLTFPLLFPTFDPTWFNISTALMVASIIGFLLIAFLIHFNHCIACITAKKGVIVSLIFLEAGWAAWSLGRLLWTAMNTFEYAQIASNLSFSYTFPATAYQAFIAVAVANIVLALVLGWYVLTCSVDNCFTIFLPLFASAAPLANWALYRVGLNVLSYVGFPSCSSSNNSIDSICNCHWFSLHHCTNPCIHHCQWLWRSICHCCCLCPPSPICHRCLLLCRNCKQSSTFSNPPPTLCEFNASRHLLRNHPHRHPCLPLAMACKVSHPSHPLWTGCRHLWMGHHLSLLHLQCKLLGFTFPTASLTILNIGLTVIIIAAVAAFLFTRFTSCDEVVGAVTFINIALLTVGGAGFTGTIAYYHPLLHHRMSELQRPSMCSMSSLLSSSQDSLSSVVV